MPIGFALPFARSSGSQGYFETTNDEFSAIRASAISLLSTNWGERPKRYYLGCNLREFCFEQHSPSLKEKIFDRIQSQFGRWLPFLGIKRAQVFFSEDDPNIPENGVGTFVELFVASRPDLTIPIFHMTVP